MISRSASRRKRQERLTASEQRRKIKCVRLTHRIKVAEAAYRARRPIRTEGGKFQPIRPWRERLNRLLGRRDAAAA